MPSRNGTSQQRTWDQNVIDRLREVLAEKDLTQARLKREKTTDAAGKETLLFPKGTVDQWFTRAKKPSVPSPRHLEQLHSRFKISPTYVLCGVGPKFTEGLRVDRRELLDEFRAQVCTRFTTWFDCIVEVEAVDALLPDLGDPVALAVALHERATAEALMRRVALEIEEVPAVMLAERSPEDAAALKARFQRADDSRAPERLKVKVAQERERQRSLPRATPPGAVAQLIADRLRAYLTGSKPSSLPPFDELAEEYLLQRDGVSGRWQPQVVQRVGGALGRIADRGMKNLRNEGQADRAE